MKRIGVVLSGCGVFDGAEIHESVFTLLAIERAGAQAICFAPDKPQLHVINHLSGETTTEKRNVLVESARIARGKVKALSDADPTLLDALVLPGGSGVAKNLSDFATQGSDCLIEPELSQLIQEMYKAGKPTGFICIAPALLPKLFKNLTDQPVRLTIGNDSHLAAMIEKVGGQHVICATDAIVVDSKHKVVTTPGYMREDASIVGVAQGIDALVKKVLELI
ncbi:isoprenoid biosynthesis glyoxalase ElbB [Mycoavidus sp. B2-EB]|uniref:isoprenoid biosynthesis glyoxalase ElbB n=1 Tax=Mycoavidus sp. B2-EB TaxID=2651972 RepID=UPI001625ABC3|nr:isoprenoid biosynthesis glyoxalase ElbB [Mycoavidus sp. B2-EB]BBO60201.1 glyoxalase [Mycoavidus sp. B2-EB]